MGVGTGGWCGGRVAAKVYRAGQALPEAEVRLLSGLSVSARESVLRTYEVRRVPTQAPACMTPHSRQAGVHVDPAVSAFRPDSPFQLSWKGPVPSEKDCAVFSVFFRATPGTPVGPAKSPAPMCRHVTAPVPAIDPIGLARVAETDASRRAVTWRRSRSRARHPISKSDPPAPDAPQFGRVLALALLAISPFPLFLLPGSSRLLHKWRTSSST